MKIALSLVYYVFEYVLHFTPSFAIVSIIDKLTEIIY